MKQFMQKISKRTYALFAMAIATVVVPATLLAWGPSTRVTFTEANPASYVTFNSITDNKTYGNETNFVQVRNVTDNTQYSDDTTLTPGKEYEVFAYYHNNANSNLNASGTGIATGAFMRTEMPSVVKAGEEARITSYVGAANAKHLDKQGKNLGNQVWDEAYGKNTTSGDIALSYVAGSAKITSKGAVNGKTLPDALWGSNGTLLGYDALDGKLPGCENYSGYVTYRFKVNQPNFTVEKTVSKSGEDKYSENVKVNAGDTVDFMIKYKNTGTTTQTVTIRDQLPAGLEYINGSTYFSNSNTGNQWKAAGHDTVTKQGLGIGQYLPGAAGYVSFSAKVAAKDKLACGLNKLTNTAAADTENGSKSDTATVEVTKECTPPVEKVKACNLDTMKIENDVDKSKIDDVHYTLDLKKCEKTPEDKDIQVCRLSDKKYPVTIKESQFDATKYSKNPEDCKTPEEKTIEVCRLSDKKYPVTIKESEFDSAKYSKNPNDCKETPPVEKCEVPGKEHLPKDSPDCKETPVEKCDVPGKEDLPKDSPDCKETPPAEEEKCTVPGKEHLPADSDDCEEDESPEVEELPETGATESILSLLGAGSLVGAARAYVASRRK